MERAVLPYCGLRSGTPCTALVDCEGARLASCFPTRDCDCGLRVLFCLSTDSGLYV